ncbi:lysophospholipid acyltransferase family protein [bacterium]|nr:lysophospholipid acyltransferase family protein [bacterium]
MLKFANNDARYPQKTRMTGRAASLLIRLWVSNLRVKTLGWENDSQAQRSGSPVLYVHWHGSQLVPLAKFSKRGIYILTSLSMDGDIQDISLKCLGFQTVRGSSSKGGGRALLSLIRKMERGFSAALAVDGPRGPYHVSKPGPVILAQRTEANVLPIGVGYDRCYYLRNWDKFEIPLPFSKSVMYIGIPFQIAKETTIEDGERIIESKISECEVKAFQNLRP